MSRVPDARTLKKIQAANEAQRLGHDMVPQPGQLLWEWATSAGGPPVDVQGVADLNVHSEITTEARENELGHSGSMIAAHGEPATWEAGEDAFLTRHAELTVVAPASVDADSTEGEGA